MMGPGKELNTLVGEKVMGWTRETVPYGDKRIPYECWMKDGKPLMTIYHWSPSEKIEDAWKVVEKLSKGVHDFKLKFNGSGYVVSFEDTEIHESDHDYKNGFAEESTAPHAICLAALKAVSEGP